MIPLLPDTFESLDAAFGKCGILELVERLEEVNLKSVSPGIAGA